jgi:WD40 repeat protein
MKNAVFWDIESQFVLHRRHITSPLQSPAGYCYVRFEVFAAMTIKNVVLWDIKTLLVPHRRHIASPAQSPDGKCYVIFEIFTSVTLKNATFWDVTPCGNGHYGRTYRLHYQGQMSQRSTDFGSNWQLKLCP